MLSMNLIGKFRVMVAIAALGLLGLTGFWLNSQRSGLLSERVERTKNLVEVPYSIMAEQHRLEVEGKISRQEAQRRAVEAIRAMRYDDTNYFWINDMHPTMVMHPIKPELDGKDLSDYKDPSGRAVFVEMTNAARGPTGGFVFYQWPKPGSDKPVQKLSFVKGFEPWGWVVGTGIYVEDVDAAWRKSAKVAGIFGLSCLAVLLIVSKRVANSIFVRFHEMIERIKDVAQGEGDLTKRVEITSNDEVGELAKWFTGRSRASQVDQAVSSSVDFARVKMAHRSWRLKLRSFLDGRENIDSKGLASHRDCELGKWIYGGGMTAYSHLHEMQELETKHKDMHGLVKHVVELKHAGKASEAEQEFSHVCEAADSVVALITSVEAQVMGSRAIGAGTLDPPHVRTITTESHFAGKN